MEIVKQYELWWASLPQPAGRRPVLLLSRDGAYAYLNKFIAVEVPLGRLEGLSQRCVANCDNIRTLSRSALVKRIGRLSHGRVPELKRAIGHALAWDELIEAV